MAFSFNADKPINILSYQTTFSLKSLPYKNISNKWCTLSSNTYFFVILWFICLFIYVFPRETGNTGRFLPTFCDHLGNDITYDSSALRNEAKPVTLYPNKQYQLATYITVKILNTTEKLNIKHVKTCQNYFCDESWLREIWWKCIWN